MKRPVSLLLALLLAGCATDVPRAIREAPAESVLPAEVLDAPESWRDRRVRWGGDIVGIENRKDETWVEIVEKPLYGNGQPRRTDTSRGRFLAAIPGFLDPAVYAKKRSITVAGTLEMPVTRTIGDYSYRYPVVRAASHHLWPAEPETVHHYYYYYDPWWPYPWRYYRPLPRK
jgi:outer membrane lipoprotein